MKFHLASLSTLLASTAALPTSPPTISREDTVLTRDIFGDIKHGVDKIVPAIEEKVKPVVEDKVIPVLNDKIVPIVDEILEMPKPAKCAAAVTLVIASAIIPSGTIGRIKNAIIVLGGVDESVEKMQQAHTPEDRWRVGGEALVDLVEELTGLDEVKDACFDGSWETIGESIEGVRDLLNWIDGV